MHAAIDILRILAWPVTVLVLALTFHGRITALLKRVSSVGYGDFSVDFDRLIAPAERALGRARPNASASNRRRLHRLRQLADQAPRAAILEAWADLAETLDGTASKADENPDDTEAAGNEVIDALAEVRNRACSAHDDEIAVDVAQRYVALAERAATAHPDERRP